MDPIQPEYRHILEERAPNESVLSDGPRLRILIDVVLVKLSHHVSPEQLRNTDCWPPTCRSSYGYVTFCWRSSVLSSSAPPASAAGYIDMYYFSTMPGQLRLVCILLHARQFAGCDLSKKIQTAAMMEGTMNNGLYPVPSKHKKKSGYG